MIVMIAMMNTRIGMTTMTRLLCTWDVEGMSAELYTLMQIAAALKRIDNNRGDEEKKISNLHIDETGEYEIDLYSLTFIPL